MDGQGTKWHRNIAENFNQLSRAHERYRRQTDKRQTGGRRHIANRPISEHHCVSLDYPRGQCQFIGCSIVVVIVLSSLRAARLNGLMRMRRARYFFFRAGPNVLPASQRRRSPRCDAKWISDASERNIARTHKRTCSTGPNDLLYRGTFDAQCSADRLIGLHISFRLNE